MNEDVASVGDNLDVTSLSEEEEETDARLPEINEDKEHHDAANGGHILQVSTRSLNDDDVANDDSEIFDGVEADGSADDDANDDQSMEPEKLIIRKEKLAIKYKNKKMLDAAIKEYIKCLALASIIYEQSDWRLYNYRVLLAFAYQELKGYSAQALQHCSVAHLFLANIRQYDIKEESTLKSPDFHKFLFNLYYTSGLALTEAEDSLLKAKNILTNVIKNKQKMGDCESNLIIALARLYHKFGKPDMSLKFYGKAAEREIAKNGEHSVKLISIYQNLGKVEQTRNSSVNHERAIEYFLKAHAVAGHK
ncbi:hypothetical protein HELRODRAFT_171119 [Helobdella robusta]|uniref:Rapsyn myristoylation/linker region N-terminal domain-containing protein n=1 Tax=Helobdella robusta TaxID=6412 RepID=T1F3U1_HELRO|nr:hypothetical protein HELRODRAFT_171119 [Helobdella robusta]ESO05487.1 hypothetical protein HELRODRAFT_171119 [Helobdella robusta]